MRIATSIVSTQPTATAPRAASQHESLPVTPRKSPLLILMLLCASCAYQRERQDSHVLVAHGESVAVIPFENLSGTAGAGPALTSLFSNELYAARFDLIPITDQAATDHDGRSPAQIASASGAKYVFSGVVTEYAYKQGLADEPAVGLSVRLIDVASGRVIWSGARSDSGGRSWISDDSLSRVAQKSCEALVATINRGRASQEPQ